MAAISNYTELQSALQQAVEDDNAELVTYLPIAIDLAEERLFKDLELPDLETKDNGALTVNDFTITKPTRYKYPTYLKLTYQGSDILLKQRTEDFITDYWPNSTLTGIPKYYCNLSSTELKVAPTPQFSFSYELKFYQIPEKLSVTGTTNYFLDNCVDLLYYAALIELAKFMKAWSQVQIWEGSYATVRDTWNLNAARMCIDNGSPAQNPDGGTNSLKQASKQSV